ncbi:MAG TPA: alpha/beta fold hydrolase [Actinocrinis sp.]|nr:alpha/beta fold hydrolase [Actinocrinis sp.]
MFVHGLFSDSATWDDFSKALRSDLSLGSVQIHLFDYETPKLRIRPDRRIPELDTIADQLRTYLTSDLRDETSVVIVTHSQGGLVVQRMLHRMISEAAAAQLSRIKSIVMFSSPNSGSAFFLSLRRILFAGRHSQEKQLRPLDRGVIEAQRTVLLSVVNARKASHNSYPIPIIACGATSDNIVPDYVATGAFPTKYVVPGDHFTVIQPKDHSSPSYTIVRNALLAPPISVDKATPGDDPDSSIPSSSAPAPSPGKDPNRQNSVSAPTHLHPPRVRGRDELIHSLSGNSPNRIHVLAGLQGVGKTCVALELARRLEAAKWDVWWIQADHAGTDMFELAHRLEIPYVEILSAQQDERQAADIVWRYLERRTENWLLVFDNANNPETLVPVQDGVSMLHGWLRSPSTDKGRVVVTSNVINHQVWGTHCTVHEVPPLNDEDGASMIRDHVDERAGTFEAAKNLSRELRGIPQSLMNAATYLKSVTGGADLADGRGRDFDTYRQAVANLESGLPQSASDQVLRSLRNSFNISAQVLIDRDELTAVLLLKILACMNRSPVPYDLLVHPERLASSALFTGVPTDHLSSAVQSLADVGLVTLSVRNDHQDPLRRRLELHPFAHMVFREEALASDRGEDYHTTVLHMLEDATKDVDPDLPESWAIWAAVALHVVTLTKNVTAVPAQARYDRRLVEAALIQAKRAARYMIAVGYFEPAAELLHPLIDSCSAYGFTADSEPILALRHEKGRLAIERGDYSAAEDQLRRLVDDRERVLGAGHPDTWATRHKLVKVILDQGGWAYAEPELQKILRAEKQIHRDEPAHRDVITVWHTLARTLLSLGRGAEAEQMCREILDLSAQSLPQSDNEVLFLLQTLARAMLSENRAHDAEQVIREAIALVNRPRSPRVLAQRHVLCLAVVAQGRLEEAVSALEELVAEEDRELGPDHPLTKSTRETLQSTVVAINENPGG